MYCLIIVTVGNDSIWHPLPNKHHLPNVFFLISVPIPISAPNANKRPHSHKLPYSNKLSYSNKCPYSNIIAVCIKQGSCSFNCQNTIRNNALQKQWSLSEFLNCYVHGTVLTVAVNGLKNEHIHSHEQFTQQGSFQLGHRIRLRGCRTR